MFRTTKLFRIHGSIVGVCGLMRQCLRFVEWFREPGPKPELSDPAAFSALELTEKGELFLWETEMIAIPIDEKCYAIGSGANFALCALDLGASPRRAILAAAKWDESTGSEVQVMTLKGKK